jgi:hypothetical protein
MGYGKQIYANEANIYLPTQIQIIELATLYCIIFNVHCTVNGFCTDVIFSCSSKYPLHHIVRCIHRLVKHWYLISVFQVNCDHG